MRELNKNNGSNIYLFNKGASFVKILSQNLQENFYNVHFDIMKYIPHENYTEKHMRWSLFFNRVKLY